ncbi:MAG: VCBS repeat-containing protein, partial [Deltaproteobacteria bacterium]|nr:VCBS repeat-containing protein [Deltaproteobacteria bacterium]
MRIGRFSLLITALGLSLPAPAWAVGKPAAGSVSAQTVKLPDGPGSVAGLSDKASVSVFSGQVGYTVPIDLPAASAGLAPSLGLAYSGELGNGPIGIGWSMNSARVQRSLRQGVPTYTDADELELVGIEGAGRLVKVAPGLYHVEGQGRSIKVQWNGAWFQVTDSNGLNYYLGLFESSRQLDGVRVAAWHVTKVVDLAGQVIDFNYIQDNGQLYLADIQWGPSVNGAPAFRADFIYEGRPDEVISYRTGFKVRTTRRLKQVKVQSFGEVRRLYELSYDDQLSFSRLVEIVAKGRAGVGALPPLRFTYASQEAAAALKLKATDGWTLNERGVSFLDVDGDGMSDLVQMEMGNHLYKKNLGGRFDVARPLGGAQSIELEDARLMDLDGDARPELVRIVDDSWRPFRLDGDTWKSLGEWGGTRGVPLHSADAVHVDINGDGRTDVFKGTATGNLLYLNSTRGLKAPISVHRISQYDVRVEPGEANVRFLDMNGDGLADVAWFTDEWIKIFLGKGDGTFVPHDLVFYPWNRTTLDVANLQLADLNRDGLVDLIRFTAGHVLWYRGHADGHFDLMPRYVERPEGADADVVVTLADANGNGSEDIVWSSPRGMWLLDLAGATSAGMLETIDNGLGKTSTIRYRASAQLAVEAELAGEPWANKLPVSIPVPVAMEIDVGVGPVRTVHYGVRDGFWDGEERRFGGFLQGRQSIAAEEGADILYEETRFHAGMGKNRVLRGSPWYVRRENGLGQVYSVAINDYEAMAPAGLGAFPLLHKGAVTQKKTLNYEGVPTPIETLATYEYDDEVRPIKETQLGRTDLTGDEAIVLREYASDDATWVRDRVCEERLLDPRLGNPATEIEKATVSRALTVYGGPSTTNPGRCQVGKGLVRMVQGYLKDGANPRWVVLATTEYDSKHNPTLVYKDGVTRSIGYDVYRLFPVSEAVRPSDAVELSWRIDQWDYVLGQPRRLVEPNGVATEVAYDTLGRPLNVAVAGAPAHVHYKYQWEARPPQTVVYQFDGKREELTSLGDSWQPGKKWRQTIAVANGGGEDLFSATRLDTSQWIISGWKERDLKARVVRVADPFYYTGSTLPVSLPTTGIVVQELEYDALDRLTVQKLPNGARKYLSYTATCQTETTDGLAPVVSCVDGLGRVIHTERTVNGVQEQVDAIHDAAGRITEMALQGGRARHGFTYDSLGRLVAGSDPDIGHRSMEYDDRGWLLRHVNGAGQALTYEYDNVGRIVRGVGEDGSSFAYHYDIPKTGDAVAAQTLGRLAWVEEPNGEAHFSYDVYGRQRTLTRTIEGITAKETVTLGVSGLPLEVSYDDGFAVTSRFDNAGRPVGVGDLWAAEEMDASGRILKERYGNGVRQVYERDSLGLASNIQVTRGQGESIYDVGITRNAYGAITQVADKDQRGLNHSAVFQYDGAARLVDATIGSAGPSWGFGYKYDGLQNMVSREVRGTEIAGLLSGSYRYGEGGKGPRQLTSVFRLTSGQVVNQIETVKNGGASDAASIAAFPDGTFIWTAADLYSNGLVKMDYAGNRTVYTLPQPATPSFISQIQGPMGVSVARDGQSAWVADTAGHRILKLLANGTFSVVAGKGGDGGYSGDGGPATSADLNEPTDVVEAADGSLYVADSANHRIRKIAPDGTITTVAGTGVGITSIGGADVGPALQVRLLPGHLALGPGGELYITNFHQVMVLRNGVIETFAGTGTAGFGGDGGPATAAQLKWPGDLAVAADGTVYIADSGNHRVRVVVPSGLIDTFAGNGTYTWSGDGGPAKSAGVYAPLGVAIDKDGHVLISPSYYGIRRVLNNAQVTAFDYDGAGRQVRQGDLRLVYNGLDELVRVERGAEVVAQHSYGFDGLRTVTKGGKTGDQFWFTPTLRQWKNGERWQREHYVRIGDRTIARVTQQTNPGDPASGGT